MILQEQSVLREKFEDLIYWEKVKKRERWLLTALFYSLLVSLAIFPFQWFVRFHYLFLSFPPVLFVLFALGIFVTRPWRERESVRVVSILDKVLHLQERALTTWEILRRKVNGPEEKLVLLETAEELRNFNPKTLFRRQLSWHFYLVPLLLLIWMYLFWLDIGSRFDRLQTSLVIPIAQKLNEFSQELAKKASEGEMKESVVVAQAIKKLSEKGFKKEIGMEEFKENIGSMIDRVKNRVSTFGRDTNRPFADYSNRDLSGLQAELNKFQDSLGFPESMAGKELSISDLYQQLSTFPLLKEELEKFLALNQNLNTDSISNFIKSTKTGTKRELDRRSLRKVEEYLLQLLNETDDRNEGGLSQNFVFSRTTRALSDSKNQASGSMPGDQPGIKTGLLSPPRVEARALAHLKGLLREGSSTGMTFMRESRGRRSEIIREETIVTYKRQMESELVSEQIPQELKETIKKYFLSLGMTRERAAGRN